MKKLIVLVSAITATYLALFLGTYVAFNDNLPDIDDWSFQPKRITKVYSADGQHLKNFLEENREILTYEEIPKSMRSALIATEDQRFFSHWGIDIRRIVGATFANVKSLNMTAQGASTITQQLARNLFTKVGRQRGSGSLDAVRATYARKMREQITAVNIERRYTKREILTMYLNTVYFGHGCYGLKSAARYYFDKNVQNLQVEECALLVGLLKAPEYYSPIRNPHRAIKRRNQVLLNMNKIGRMSRTTYARLKGREIVLRRKRQAETYGLAPYFVEHIRQQLNRQFGSALYRDGFTVQTTLNSKLQRIAEKYFEIEIGKVQARVDEYLAKQDSTTSAVDSGSIVQAAFVALDPKTGRVLAMIGGRDFVESKFNRATQAKRLPGSAFKPFVYTAAVDNGWFPTDVIDDNAVTLWEKDGKLWDPENYDRKFKGDMTLREAFKQSRNLIAIKLAQEIGPGLIKNYARHMGITTRISAVPTIGIGTSAVHLLDLVAAYCVFPNKGVYVEPVVVSTVEDRAGSQIYDRAIGRKREVLRPATAIVMTDMMRSVIDDLKGTGHRIRSGYHFKPAAAGKTGTTNDYADAWFIGFTPHIVAGVWVGMDDQSLALWPKQAGSVAALPLWVQFMKAVYAEVDYYMERADETFEYPETLVVPLSVCNDSHEIATRYCPDQAEDIFIRNEPVPRNCTLHSSARNRNGRPQRF